MNPALLASLLLLAAPAPAPASAPAAAPVVIASPIPARALALAREANQRLEADDARGALPLFQQAWDAGDHSEPTTYAATCAAARLGNLEGAFGWLGRALDAGLVDAKLLREDEDLAALRADPRFVQLLARAGKNLAALGDPKLREELLARAQTDQAARQALMRAGPAGQKALARKMMEVDRENTAFLSALLRTRGWPGQALVGRDGAHAAWLLVQHADQNPGLQQEALSLMERALARRDVDALEVAYLVDRVRVSQQRPQRFGTQFFPQDGKLLPRPIEDAAHVDERRGAVGLGTLEAYTRQMARSYGGMARAKAAAEQPAPDAGR